jgi:hypothetical protein
VAKAFVKYVKEGWYIPGVPTGDMTKEEWESLPAHLREKCLQSGVYKLAGKSKKQEGEG